MFDKQHVHYAILEIEGCKAELFVNGIPVLRLVPGPFSMLSNPVQHVLVDGENRLELVVEPGDRPSETRHPLRQARLPGVRARARIARFLDGDVVNMETGEAWLDIRYEGDAERDDILPHVAVGRTDFGELAGRWAFEDAPVLTLDEPLVAEAHERLQEIARVIREGSLEEYVALYRVVMRERQRAYPAIPEGHLEKGAAFLWNRYRQTPDPVLPLARDQHDFRLVADGRLLECLDLDFQPSLRVRTPEGSIVPFGILLARIGGRLEIAR